MRNHKIYVYLMDLENENSLCVFLDDQGLCLGYLGSIIYDEYQGLSGHDVINIQGVNLLPVFVNNTNLPVNLLGSL